MHSCTHIEILVKSCGVVAQFTDHAESRSMRVHAVRASIWDAYVQCIGLGWKAQPLTC